MLLSGVTIFICAVKLTKNVLQRNNKVCLPSSIWPESVELSLILTGFGLALSPSVFSIWNNHATTNKTFCWYRNFTTKFNNFVWIGYHGISDFIISSFQVCKKVISFSRRLSAKKIIWSRSSPILDTFCIKRDCVLFFKKQQLDGFIATSKAAFSQVFNQYQVTSPGQEPVGTHVMYATAV